MMERRVFEEHLEKNIIPFWNRLRDEEHGGFYGYVDAAGKPDPSGVKGVILNSRILWFYSAAYQLLKKKELLEMARHAYKFLTDFCFDSQYGGVYWSVNADGSVCDSTKHTYNQAFSVYALSAYYEASGNREALNMAYILYRTIEEKCADEGGYLESFNREFVPTDNDKLSENGVLAKRTMNTLLHVMEAYTELYKADAFYRVGDSIRRILRLFHEKVYDGEKKRCQVFFDETYESLIDLESYGHDIETSWLIDRSCKVLADRGYELEMQPLIDALAVGVYEKGIDRHLQAVNDECENGRVDCRKIWWVQAEGVTGFYNAYQNHPEKTEYLRLSENIWNFIQTHMIDRNTGEWYEETVDAEHPDLTRPLVQPWKCPYHNGRMCMEMMQRLSEAV